MQKISINLLPVEFSVIQEREKRFYKVQAISIAVLLLLIFLASTTVALGYLQSKQVKQAQSDLSSAENLVSGLKDKESSLMALKNRINNIQQIQKDPSKQRTMYNLIDSLIPSNITVNSISIDKGGDVLISAVFRNISLFDDFVENLVSKEKNEGRITTVGIENLSRARDGQFRASFKVDTK